MGQDLCIDDPYTSRQSRKGLNENLKKEKETTNLIRLETMKIHSVMFCMYVCIYIYFCFV